MYNGHLFNDPACSAVNAAESSDEQPNSSRSSYIERYGTSRNNITSSLPTVDFDSMTEVVIDDLVEIEPTSAILDFCKKRFLKPYVHLLGFAGLRPMSVDYTCCQMCMSHLQTGIVLVLLIIAYLMQYFTSFRRDRGFYSNSSALYSLVLNQPYHRDARDFGELLFVYAIPGFLHFFGFLSAIYVFRIVENEQLQNLVERVFLLSSKPKRLCVILWLHVVVGILCLGLLLSYVLLTVTPYSNVMEVGTFEKPKHKIQLTAKVFLLASLLVHDGVQIMVITTHAIQCYLLKLHLVNLKEKLIQHTIEPIDWMREILEFRKLLNHLNRKIATPVCFFTTMNLAYAFATLIYLFQEYEWNCALKAVGLNIANFTLWLIVGLTPFFQAASVTRMCKSVQASGHKIRVRPFVYHNTPAHDLDSTLLFASSLNMSAKLFRMPIQGNYLCCTLLVILVVVITLGMCLNVSLGNI